jgi:macrolide-specific efflux system membrane fusion protein
MFNNKLKIVFVVLGLLVISIFVMFKMKSAQGPEIIQVISPHLGTIQTFISTTGTVLPQNRLEVKPQVNGRIENILVKEGQKIKVGQILGWMSSTERAALLDAAQGQGSEVLDHWKQIYKPIPILSPIDGEVIVATIQPGQTVTTADDVVVLSDHLIVRAQVDETDIGKIQLGQKAFIGLDAYPDQRIEATVEHIYYESSTVNNVTIYNVDLLPKDVPTFFRSGMNSSIDFETANKENVLLLQADAIQKGYDGNYVLLEGDDIKHPVKRAVKLGTTDDKDYEILDGLRVTDKVLLITKKFIPPSSSKSSNPFMPNFSNKSKQSGLPPS